MDRGKHKQPTYKDYIAFYHDLCADRLTCDQLNQILIMHGSVHLKNHDRETVIDAVTSLNLILPSRSTFSNGTAQPGSSGATPPLSLEDTKLDITKDGWGERPIGSVATICPTVNGAAADDDDDAISRSSSCVSVTSSRSKKIVKGKDKRIFKKENIDGMSVISALLSLNSGGEPPKGNKMIRVLAKNLRDADEYSWRNKGTQWIKGLPFPRTYYRCKRDGCPAIRHVDRDPANSSVLIISYKLEHNHK